MLAAWPALFQHSLSLLLPSTCSQPAVYAIVSKMAHLEGWATAGQVVSCDPQGLCMLTKHAGNHRGNQHLPVLDPVIKLLTDLGCAFCLWWW
jgi:hypothetical protein